MSVDDDPTEKTTTTSNSSNLCMLDCCHFFGVVQLQGLVAKSIHSLSCLGFCLLIPHQLMRSKDFSHLLQSEPNTHNIQPQLWCVVAKRKKWVCVRLYFQHCQICRHLPFLSLWVPHELNMVNTVPSASRWSHICAHKASDGGLTDWRIHHTYKGPSCSPCSQLAVVS